MYFWQDFLQPHVRPSNTQIIHLLQTALVVVGGTSQTINMERRQIAWSRTIPKLKALADESYEDKKDNLFGLGCLSKKMNSDKAINKISLAHKRPFEQGPTVFLAKGAPDHCGGKGKQC